MLSLGDFYKQKGKIMNKKAIKTCIIICWCLLATCMIFKLCGSKIFEVAVTNQRFIDICNWLDGKGIYAKYVLAGIMSITSTTFLMLSASFAPKPNRKQIILILCVVIPIWFVKVFFAKIGFILDCVSIIVVPAIISKKWWAGFLGLILNIAFQVASMYIRGIEVATIFASNTILSLIFSIDYYIMIALYYMYTITIKIKKKEVTA